MKLLVFGATGRTGRIFVQKALAEGHEITVYVRDPSKLEQGPEKLTVVHGELMEKDKIEKAVQNQDAVISLLAPRRGVPGQPVAHAAADMVKAMEKHRVPRIIDVATPAVPDERDAFDAKYKLMQAGERTFTKEQSEDIRRAAEAVRASDTDWTILRVPFLTNKPGTGKVKAGFPGKGEFRTTLTREDLADFILSQLTDDHYTGQAPMVIQAGDSNETS
ncbi:NAD(P)-dependent oxidoreductase [Salibacterium sp. K-3]